MEPTLIDGDIVIVERDRTICDEDIVVCDAKRLYIDDNYIIKRYKQKKSDFGIYVEGDNTNNSFDSRNYGELSKKDIIGVAIFRISFKRGLKFLN